MTIKVGDRVRVARRTGYSFDADLADKLLTVVAVGGDCVRLRVDFPHGRTRDGRLLYRSGEEWNFDVNGVAKVEPYEQPNTPARVRAQHAAERLVGRMTGCGARAVRALHREAYRAAYRAFRACQRGVTP